MEKELAQLHSWRLLLQLSRLCRRLRCSHGEWALMRALQTTDDDFKLQLAT